MSCIVFELKTTVVVVHLLSKGTRQAGPRFLIWNSLRTATRHCHIQLYQDYKPPLRSTLPLSSRTQSFSKSRDLMPRPGSPSRSLSISLTSSDIDAITRQNKNIVVCRHVQGSSFHVVWESIPPEKLSTSIKLSWSEEFAVFSVEQNVVGGDLLCCPRNWPAPLGSVWKADHQFSNFIRDPTPPIGGIRIVDKQERRAPRVMGLAQRCQVNDDKSQPRYKPIAVAHSEQGVVTTLRPKIRVYIFLAQLEESQVVSISPDLNACEILYRGSTAMSVAFDDSSLGFVEDLSAGEDDFFFFSHCIKFRLYYS